MGKKPAARNATHLQRFVLVPGAEGPELQPYVPDHVAKKMTQDEYDAQLAEGERLIAEMEAAENARKQQSAVSSAVATADDGSVLARLTAQALRARGEAGQGGDDDELVEVNSVAGDGDDDCGGEGDLCESSKGEEEDAWEAYYERLEKGERYFPDDGYNYEQHLRAPGQGRFHAATDSGLAKQAEVTYHSSSMPAGGAPHLLSVAAGGERPLSKEEREALEALENPELYDQLDEDDAILDEERLDREGAAREVMWGKDHVVSMFARPEERAAQMAAARGAGGGSDAAGFLQSLGRRGGTGIGARPAGRTGRRYGRDATDRSVASNDYAWGAGSALGDDELVEAARPTAAATVLDRQLDRELEMDEPEAVDGEELAGVGFSEDAMLGLLKEFERDQHSSEPVAAILRKPIAPVAALFEREDGEDSEEEPVPERRPNKASEREWDIETAMTARSRSSNLPGGISLARKPRAKLAAVAEAEEVEEAVDVVFGLRRKKGETGEEKKARKAATKEAKQTTRNVKKDNKNAIRTARSAMGKENPYDVRQGARRVHVT